MLRAKVLASAIVAATPPTDRSSRAGRNKAVLHSFCHESNLLTLNAKTVCDENIGRVHSCLQHLASGEADDRSVQLGYLWQEGPRHACV